jgi:hypothetical protein
LKIGDTVDLRLDLNWTTSVVSTRIDLSIEMAVGSGSSYQIPLTNTTTFKDADTYNIASYDGIYIGSQLEIDYPARLLARQDTANGTIDVKGWYIRVTTNG